LGGIVLFIDNYFQNQLSSKKKILLLKKSSNHWFWQCLYDAWNEPVSSFHYWCAAGLTRHAAAEFSFF
jgi:hypothetical protein